MSGEKFAEWVRDNLDQLARDYAVENPETLVGFIQWLLAKNQRLEWDILGRYYLDGQKRSFKGRTPTFDEWLAERYKEGTDEA